MIPFPNADSVNGAKQRVIPFPNDDSVNGVKQRVIPFPNDDSVNGAKQRVTLSSRHYVYGTGYPDSRVFRLVGISGLFPASAVK